MNAFELKKYIIENELIESILINLDMHHIKNFDDKFRFGIPNHENASNGSIKKENLYCKIYKRDETFKGDI